MQRNFINISLQHVCSLQHVFSPVTTKCSVKMKINCTKNAFFFLSQTPTHHSFTFNLRFLNEVNRNVRLSKTMFAIFDSVSFLLKMIFLLNKMHGLFDFLERLFKIKITEKSHTVLLLDQKISKLQREVLKFSDICVSWSSLKTDLKINFLNLENRSFGNVIFS